MSSYLLPSPHSNIHKFHNKTQSRFLFSFPISKINNVRSLKTQSRFLFPFPISKINHVRSLKTRCASDDDSSFHGVDFIVSILPGGNWWSLPKHREDHAEPTEAKLALRRMLELVADERWVAVVAFGSLVIAALSEITMPSILAASIFLAQSGETAAFSRNAMFLVLLCFTSGICSGLRSGCFGILNVTLVKRLQENLYTAILFQDISYFDKEKVGTLTSRLAADCQQLSHVIGNDLQLILRNSLQGTGAIINLLVLSWPLALSALMICSVLSAIFLVYGRYRRKAAKLTQDFSACANDVAQETLSLIRTVRVYGTRKEEFERYNQWLQKLAFISSRDSLGNGLWNLSFNTLFRSTQIFAVLLGGMSALSCCVTVEQLTKYVLYCEWLIFATWRVTNSLSSLMQSIGASEQIFEMMNRLPCDQFLVQGIKLQRLMGHIQFVDVSFHYPARSMLPVLEHLNFSVKANEVIAIVGLSGSGKSTLINLLLRLYEPCSGQVRIDGFPLKELDIRWLRQNIGYVAQEPHIFHMDIKSNIGYGCPRNINQEDIINAAKLAYAHDFISSLPNSYDTLVDGNVLSGGQKQRIAIARAIIRDPVVMILDEPTSALDSESEHYIKEVLCTLRNETSSRTIIIIAHRLSTVKAADRIIVMDNGRIIEMGNHEELLAKDGLYAKLNKIQADVF